MRLKVFLLHWILLVQAQSHLFDYGTRAGDQTLETSSGQHAVAIDVPMVYMENSYNEIYISPNGIIGFGERLPDGIEPLQRLNKSAIAVFYAPVSEGKIYFRTTSSDQRLIRRLTDYIHKTFADSSEFSTLQAMVVTWHEMQNKELDDKATFQLVLASDGMTTYAIIQFLALPWSASGGIYAQSGFSLADGRHRSNINSGTPDVKDLVGLSNNPEGSFVFRISGATIEDPRENVDDYDYTNYDQTDYDGDDRKPPADCPVDPYGDRCPEGCNILTDERHCSRCVCAEPNPEDGAEDNQLSDYTVHEKLPQRPHAPSVDRRTHDGTSEPQRERDGTDKRPGEPEREREHEQAHQYGQTEQHTNVMNCASAGQEACSQNALCRDFTSGFCCECRPGFYGNGKECLKNGDPQRISGSFEGVINGIPIDRTDLHTFITPTDGHAYTAISKIPSDLGYPLLLLNPIGSIMGWLFAEVKSPSVYNGFQLTGGLFNRTVTLHIGDRSHLTIRQQFSGRDIYHYFKSTVFVSGTLPDIAPDTEIVFPNYEEEYRRERPGLVRSYTGVDILLKEAGQQRTIRMTIDQQIQFEECTHQNFDKDSTVALQVEGVHVTYDSHEGIVRYASRNYANEVGRGRNPSESDMDSSTDRRQQAGPQHQAQNPTTNRGEDICVEGRHVCTLPNMRCRPVEPSYRCECLPGYQATRDESSPLGWKCQDLNECERGDHTCDQNAVCSNTDGSFTCECRPGYDGDGHRCTRHHVAELDVPVEPILHGTTQHQAGSCTNHQQCHQWGECVFVDGSPYGHCRCRGWYTGDGVNHCGPPEEEPRRQTEQRGRPCGEHVCDVNADCMPSPSGGSECVCKAGFVGNGVICESLTIEDFPDGRRPITEGTLEKPCRSHEECSEHGSCAYSDTLGYYHCVCTKPYEGDGIECRLKDDQTMKQPGCDELRNCGENAQCVYDSHNRIYRCECHDGYAGDGMTCVKIHSGSSPREGEQAYPKQCRDSTDCHQYGHCVVGSDSRYVCECLPGYRGDGIQHCVVADRCSPADPSACAQNAECIYEEVERAYVCKCVRGFTGDGVHCIPHARPQTCQEEPRLCHANAQCVYNSGSNTYVCTCKPGTVGDGTHRCDLLETPRCSNCSSNAHCVQSPQTGGWQCRCNPGYHGNGHLCVAMTSCLDDRSICDPHAECVPGEGGHYVCNCHYGYHGNGLTCTPDSETNDDILLISRGMAIFQRGINPDVPGKQLIVIPHHIAVGLDYDCQEKRFVWSDISGHSIRSASMNGSDQQSFFTNDLNSPEGIAVDWSSKNVYYADSLNDEIGVASLDGKYQKALITEGLVNPRALALDMQNRHLYYTDWHRENPVIGRVDMDGRNNHVFLNEDVHLPNGITILPNRRELCWVDAGNHRLSCIGLNGNNRRVVFAPLQHPFGLTHNNEAKFYWTDWKDNQIHSVGIYGDGYKSFPISLGGSGKVYGILALPKHCMGPQTACSVDNGGCAYLCLPGQEGVHCECPSNVAVQGC